jgi:hypothetical protein
MIFNTFAYYLLFLLPAATLYRCSAPRFRPWVITVTVTGVGLDVEMCIPSIVRILLTPIVRLRTSDRRATRDAPDQQR